MTTPLPKSKMEMVESGGRLAQLLGLPRSTGQVYGLLCMSASSLSLDEIAQSLGISKASVSNSARHLSSWGAIRQVWRQGERKDYYEVVDDVSALIARGLNDFMKPRLASSRNRLAGILDSLAEDFDEGRIDREEYRVCAGRVKTLERFRKKVRAVAPVVEKMF